MFVRTHDGHFEFVTPFCLADGDTGTNGAGGDSGSTTPGDNGSATPPNPPAPAINLAEFAASLEKLNDNLGSKLDTIHTTIQTPPDTPAEPVDLENMSRAEFAAHMSTSMLDQFKAVLAETLAPITQNLDLVQRNVVSNETKTEIASLRASNKDFDDWKPEMIELAKAPQYAALGITDLYHLARARAPAKQAELTKKYNPPADTPRRPTFGGLTNGVANGSADAKVLSHRDAGLEAYREVQARHSDVLPALETL